MERKKLTLGLFGFGVVGSGLYEVLQKTPTLKTSIKKICVKTAGKERSIDLNLFTFNKYDILNDPEINVVVELIDDADAAFDIVSTALKNGKAVVSANKKMIAEHFSELLELQHVYKAPLLYEGACCASMPIIRNLEEYYDNDLLECIEGIINGSTNYILSKTFDENLSYDQALKQAQAKGYAESNPILDTGGFDAKYKLLILIAHAFGLVLKPEDIFNVGIDNIGDLELQYAREKGYKIKLVAHALKTSNGNFLTYLVMPKFIDTLNKLYTVDDVFNGVITKTSFADTQFFVGRGAGAYPTASAVLSDISALTYEYKYEYKKLGAAEDLIPDENILLKILLRCSAGDLSFYKKYFNAIHETYANETAGYIIGTLPLRKLKSIGGSSRASTILYEILN